MKLSVSNIGWSKNGIDQNVTRDELIKSNISYVELAPALTWENPSKITSVEKLKVKNFWNSVGIEICALQSLLYQRTDLQLFGNRKSQKDLLAYMLNIVDVAKEIGAKTLVFGSPLNRIKGLLTKKEADLIALDFFRTLDQKIAGLGLNIAIEPNPTVYNCDYLTSATEVINFLEKLKSENIKMNFDLACTVLGGENPVEVFPKAIGFISHIHISEPDLSPIEHLTLPHRAFSDVLKINSDLLHSVKISMEMRDPTAEGFRTSNSITKFKEIYLAS